MKIPDNNLITRLLSLDVFRGITIAIMIIVNSPGNQTAYTQLEHAKWHGCTLADLVFPFFLIIVGMSSTIALTNLKQKGIPNKQLITKIINRSVYLFAIGLLLNAFPHHFDFSNLRWLGVLQRIAICYFFASILFLITSIRTQVIIIMLLLSGYWLLMICFATTYPLTMNDNLVGYLDRLLLSSHHLYMPLFDPEGLLTTLPAIASTLIGALIGRYLLSKDTQKQQLYRLITAALLLAMLGWLWGFLFPINKSLWSSSYVLWTSGLALLMFSCCFALIEIWQSHYWAKPFNLFGRHAMLVYVLHVLFLKIQAIILLPNNDGNLINLRLYLTDRLFGHFNAQNASLCYAISYTVIWLLILIAIAQWRIIRLRPLLPAN